MENYDPGSGQVSGVQMSFFNIKVATFSQSAGFALTLTHAHVYTPIGTGLDHAVNCE